MLKMKPQNDDSENAIEIFAEYNLSHEVVEMVRRFGGENRDTALIIRAFMFDEDFDLIWQTQFQRPTRDPVEQQRQRAMHFGIMTMFGGPHLWDGSHEIGSLQCDLQRWQKVTAQLRELGESENVTGAWLYGWALFGLEIIEHILEHRVSVWDTRLRRLGIDYADELPGSLDELLQIKGFGPAVARRFEDQLLDQVMAGVDESYLEFLAEFRASA